jgi:hypothetical protein
VLVWGNLLKKLTPGPGGTVVRTRDLPNVKCRARRLATVLGEVSSEEEMLYSSLKNSLILPGPALEPPARKPGARQDLQDGTDQEKSSSWDNLI